MQALGAARPAQVPKEGRAVLQRHAGTLATINAMESEMRALTDEELAGTTARLRGKLARGLTLDGLLPEAFAACREAARRCIGMRHYDVQIVSWPVHALLRGAGKHALLGGAD